jgi:acyl-CoA synthetase (AMP-forming)/AMP-acid ligase II
MNAVNPLALRAARSTVYSLFSEQARRTPMAPAMRQGLRTLTYGELDAAVSNAAHCLHAAGMRTGDRVAVLSQNCIEYTLIQLAAARLGAIVACLNWRLSPPELSYCIGLVRPRLLLVSERFEALRAATILPVERHCELRQFLQATPGELAAPTLDLDPEAGLLLLYTSGTTGDPKAALISHRAEIARMCALRLDLGLAASDGYIAWSPMYHMGGTEHTLATLMSGGEVAVVDGMDADAIVDALAAIQVGWLLLVPATIEPVLARLEARGVVPRGVRVVGCMADLVPRELIARTSRVFKAPFLNSFGATETGMPPASADVIPIGVAPEELGKRPSSLCELRIVNPAGEDVVPGEAGEILVRAATLFSGYWNAESVNESEFKQGWFRMGDLFRATANGRLEFVGRAKYLIKTGGENVYPAEIERVLLADPRVADAAVVRQPDNRWGEVPVAFIARRDLALDAAAVMLLCRAQLASYKCPKHVRFIEQEDFPRSATGKIVREELELRLASGAGTEKAQGT